MSSKNIPPLEGKEIPQRLRCGPPDLLSESWPVAQLGIRLDPIYLYFLQ